MFCAVARFLTSILPLFEVFVTQVDDHCEELLVNSSQSETDLKQVWDKKCLPVHYWASLLSLISSVYRDTNPANDIDGCLGIKFDGLDVTTNGLVITSHTCHSVANRWEDKGLYRFLVSSSMTKDSVVLYIFQLHFSAKKPLREPPLLPEPLRLQ